MKRKIIATAALLSASALALAGCAGSPAPAATTPGGDDGTLQVVASTNVYGQIAEALGAGRVEVTSIISSLSQDPHAYEASAQDQLSVSRADVLIVNGGGYDSFMDALIDGSGATAPVITAVEFSHDWPGGDGHDDHADDHADDDHADEHADDHAGDDHADEHADDDHAGHNHVEGFNEHVWYDPHTIAHVAEAITEEFTELDPDGTADYKAALSAFTTGIENLEDQLGQIEAGHAGAKFFATEPVPVYLLTAAGLVNVAPDEFTEAVEEGQDVPPAVLLEADRILTAGDVSGVIVNAQTGGAETTRVIDTAKGAGIPVLEFTELVPDGMTYLEWMTQNVADIAGTLTR